MRTAILGLVAAFGVLTCGTALAKKPPVPPPNISASFVLKVDIFGEQLPPSAPIYDESITLSISHSFELTSSQEAALQADTTVTLLGIEFNPGDDPDFQTGDKSATINTVASLGVGVADELPITVTIKWGNGKFTGTVKGKLKLKDIALPAPPEAVTAGLAGIKPLKTGGFAPRQDLFLQAMIQHSSIPDLIVEAYLASDVEQSMTEGFTAEGGAYVEQIIEAKSKFFAPLP